MTPSRRTDCPTPAKQQFFTERSARQVAKRINARVYRCRCGVWHLTTTPSHIHKRRRRRARRDQT